MVVSVIIAVSVVLLFSAGPTMVDAGSPCLRDSADASDQSISGECTKCEVERVQAAMRSKPVPKELKVRTAFLHYLELIADLQLHSVSSQTALLTKYKALTL